MKAYEEVLVDKQGAGQEVAKFVRQACGLSARNCQALFRKKQVRVNGKPAHSKRILREGDKVRLPALADTSYGVTVEHGPLEVLYEDDYVLVVNKPPYTLVHPTEMTREHTLANYVAGYYESKGQVHTVRPVHRLDRDTSGCLMFAKTREAQAFYTEALADNRMKRTYHAWVEGAIIAPKGAVDAPIGPHPTKANRRAVVADGQPAHTDYRVLAYIDDKGQEIAYEEASESLQQGAPMTLLELGIPTGRTHQIRVHMAHIGHPVAGDRMYGSSKSPFKRQCLHAYRLAFPLYGKDSLQVVTAEKYRNFNDNKKL